MNHLFVLAAIATSIALMVWLWSGDPKRRRVAKLPVNGVGANWRLFVTAAVLLPGVVLAALGDSAAFLIWLGSCAMGGWLLAQLRGRKAIDKP